MKSFLKGHFYLQTFTNFTSKIFATWKSKLFKINWIVINIIISISLSLLYIPPFPSLSLENARTFTDPQTGGSRNDLAVKVKPIFQRRFTMRDISALETRIDRIEYYTALYYITLDYYAIHQTTY